MVNSSPRGKRIHKSDYDQLQEVKHAAYKAAVNGVTYGFTKKWTYKYMENTPLDFIFTPYRRLVDLYADYLESKISKDEAEKKMRLIEEGWLNPDPGNGMKEMLAISAVIDKAFKDKGIEFGEIDITCPKCNEGIMHVIRNLTPPFLGGYHCDKCDCGVTIMS